MSFITKRERVFNEYDLFDLPPRNEGKLKAYASCTDARAWSHFCSDKTEHLVEIIKRNNDTCRPKYLPTDVIVQTLMVAKNAEITRLKHKIEEFEQMLAVYDQLELTCDQKCEIANAHAEIKAANKELDDLCLDLDLSGFTEGMESDAFETGKSRGDEPGFYSYQDEAISKGNESVKSRGGNMDDMNQNRVDSLMTADRYKLKRKHTAPIPDKQGRNKTKNYMLLLLQWNSEKAVPKKDTKSNQTSLVCSCNVSTSAEDLRIQEMQETIISKDAKLNAQQNTIAVMENDLCEPYCIYAHINTALEKIFAVLCQNVKYKLYLNLMTPAKNTRCLDIRGKILYKLKVLEKFSLALIAPCSQENASPSSIDCACFRAEIVARIDFPQSAAELKKPAVDNERSHLVADIMENEEMKEILSKDSSSYKNEDYQTDDGLDDYSIDTENLKRLKDLQNSYEELMNCYEKLKYENENLHIRCQKYDELEKEFEQLRSQLLEYNALWNEKEHYRKRSLDIDSLKEQYLVLIDETTNLETQLKAELEINSIKSNTIEDLRNDNIVLQKKLNEAYISFEKEKNYVECKLKETECTVMCQEQQIKSLSIQIDRLLEQGQDRINDDPAHILSLINEVETLKAQITNLKDALYGTEKEKQNLQDDFQNKLTTINELRMEIDNLKSSYEKTLKHNNYLEKYTNDIQEKMEKLSIENKFLSEDIITKSDAIENLRNVLNGRTFEVDRLRNEIEISRGECNNLQQQLQEQKKSYNQNINAIDNGNAKTLKFLHLARQESQDILNKVNYYDTIRNSDTFKNQVSGFDKDLFSFHPVDQSQAIGNSIQSSSYESKNIEALSEIQILRQINSKLNNSIDILKDDQKFSKESLELTKKESESMKLKLLEFEHALKEKEVLIEDRKCLIKENHKLENDLKIKKSELDCAIQSINLCKTESEKLLTKLEILKAEEEDKMSKQHEAYQKELNEKYELQIALQDKNIELLNLSKSLNVKKEDLIDKTQKINALKKELKNIKTEYESQLNKNNVLQNTLSNKACEISNLCIELDSKTNENHNLMERIRSLDKKQAAAYEKINLLENSNLMTLNTLNNLKKESMALISKLEQFETLQNEYEKLKAENISMTLNLSKLEKFEGENLLLYTDNQSLRGINEDLEKSLNETRKQLFINPEQKISTPENILIELDKMKKEKYDNYNKIKDLLNKLDEARNEISNITADLLARDDKIVMLENHINKLEDEIRNLHKTLGNAIDTGEQISVNSIQKYDLSIKGLKAQHSKAAHNIKMELACLQREHSKLEQQMCATKLKSEESSKDKNRYLSQLNHLQNERKTIVNAINRLETTHKFDSVLSLDNCGVDDILDSLNRISKSLDAKSSLEKTFLNVQSSSQVLLNKADEAKKIIEKEKQKINMEKEEAVQEKQQMENRLNELAKRLEYQKTHDTEIIKDLEANILNKDLIFQNDITKLKEKLKNLESLYNNSISELTIFQEKIKQLSDENKNYLDINNDLNSNLKEKLEIIGMLQKDLDVINNKTYENLAIQTKRNVFSHAYCQTKKNHNEADKSKELKKTANSSTSTIFQCDEPLKNKLISNLLPKQNPHYLNEVQILTANTEPTFDYVKSYYVNYKIHRLGTSKLEQNSIETEIFMDTDSYSNSISSKFNDDERNKTATRGNELKSVSYTELNSKIQSPKKKKERVILGVPVKQSTNEDLLLIYKDGETNNDNYSIDSGSLWTGNQNQQELNKIVSKGKVVRKAQTFQEKSNFLQNYMYPEDEFDEDDSVKAKLNINAPRVDNDNLSIISASDVDKKSLDYHLHLSPKTNSLTNIKFNNNVEMKTLKYESSPPTLSNEEINLDSQISIQLDSEDNYSRTLHYENTKSVFYTNDIRSSAPSSKTQKQLQIDGILKEDQNLSDEIKLYSRNKKLSSQVHDNDLSNHNLLRVNAVHQGLLRGPEMKSPDVFKPQKLSNFALDYILDTVQQDQNSISTFLNNVHKSKSDDRLSIPKLTEPINLSNQQTSSLEYSNITSSNEINYSIDIAKIRAVNLNDTKPNEKKIKDLTKTLELAEKDYKNKLHVIKSQYDSNIKNIVNDHNQGVKNIQNLHEETLQDLTKRHENEVENLRSMSIEANLKAQKLEKENWSLKNIINKIRGSSSAGLDKEPTKMSSEGKKLRKSRKDSKMLSKTNVVECNVDEQRGRTQGPCTCSLDMNISDTLRNIFKQVDVNQRKLAEYTYMKYIANKVLSGNIEALDAQELSFLHLKVCQTWKMKLSKEEALQKRIENLESELIDRQRCAQEHIAELDRKVEEEKRRLQEVREKVCRNTPIISRTSSPEPTQPYMPVVLLSTTMEKETRVPSGPGSCNTGMCGLELTERRSTGYLPPPGVAITGQRPKRIRMESNRAVSAKLSMEEKKEKKLYSDEPPTRLRRSHERNNTRAPKK